MELKANGIDISKYQHPVDWDKLAAQYRAGTIGFVILRAGYGYSTTDERFEEYYAEATKRGIPLGAYWYAYWGAGTPTQEANAFLSVVFGKTFTYGIWYDVEYEKSITGLDKTTRTNKVLEALGALAASGRYCGLYASTDMINNRLEYARLSAYDVWVAQYASKNTCKMAYGMWQFTSSGQVSGINTRVDLDHAYKDYPAMVKGTLATGNTKTPADNVPTDDPAPRDTVTLSIGPATGGDLRAILDKAKELGLYQMGILDIGPMTDGDAKTILALADGLGLTVTEA